LRLVGNVAANYLAFDIREFIAQLAGELPEPFFVSGDENRRVSVFA
jgi:hypothetical protein